MIRWIIIVLLLLYSTGTTFLALKLYHYDVMLSEFILENLPSSESDEPDGTVQPNGDI